MLFREDISRKFIAKWPSFYKWRVIADCRNLHHMLMTCLHSRDLIMIRFLCVCLLVVITWGCTLIQWWCSILIYSTRMGQWPGCKPPASLPLASNNQREEDADNVVKFVMVCSAHWKQMHLTSHLQVSQVQLYCFQVRLGILHVVQNI